MKIKSLKLNNFANYSEFNVSFDENVTYFIGKNGSGKSTAGVTAIHAMFMGIAEKGNALIGERFRFIGPKSATATGEMVLHDEKLNIDVLVKRKITKTGNEVSFEAPEGYEVSQQWLEDLFNVFLISPKKFIELSPKKQSEALGIDTLVYDNKIKALKADYTLINRDLTNLGSFEAVEEVKKVDLAELSKEKDDIILFNSDQDKKQLALDNADITINNKNAAITTEEGEIEALELKLKIAKNNLKLSKDYLFKLKQDKKLLPQPEDKKSLDAVNEKIQNASETNENATKYEQFIEKKTKRDKLKKDLEDNKKLQSAQDVERTNYIKSQKLPFDNLEINEDGELLLSGKPIREPYFSTGELIKVVPILMAAKNPDLKYVFIQDFNLLDEDKQNEVETHLVAQGMQLVIELVGTKKVNNKNSILLKDNAIVEDYEDKKPNLL